VFTVRLGLTLLIAALAAAVAAPAVAPLIAWAGFHFPFPRIFDRVVMVTLAIAIVWEARHLNLLNRLRAGFANPLAGFPAAALGLAFGALAIAILWGLAWWSAPVDAPRYPASFVGVLGNSLASAITIAVFEEAFFRALLLDGMKQDFGRRAALFGSSLVYAIAHLIRSPARFEVSEFRPLAGLHTLVGSLAQLGHPREAAPGLLGLFLLGLVLGVAFIQTRRVYLSIGIHASLITGARTWRKLAPGAQSAPRWLSGWGPPPLISGAAAWLLTLALLAVVVRWSKWLEPSGIRSPQDSDGRLESLSYRENAMARKGDVHS
jgi:membrane protease YdiL (CAAX protease family)